MEDETDVPRWRRWLLNRFVLTPAILLLIAGTWAVYAETHSGGHVSGRVVDAQGRPVEGADVTLWVFNFTTFREAARARTGPDGTFLLTGNPSHSIQVGAQKAGLGSSQRVPVRLYFRAQDTALGQPLVLAGAG